MQFGDGDRARRSTRSRPSAARIRLPPGAATGPGHIGGEQYSASSRILLGICLRGIASDGIDQYQGNVQGDAALIRRERFERRNSTPSAMWA